MFCKDLSRPTDVLETKFFYCGDGDWSILSQIKSFLGRCWHNSGTDSIQLWRFPGVSFIRLVLGDARPEGVVTRPSSQSVDTAVESTRVAVSYRIAYCGSITKLCGLESLSFPFKIPTNRGTTGWDTYNHMSTNDYQHVRIPFQCCQCQCRHSFVQCHTW